MKNMIFSALILFLFTSCKKSEISGDVLNEPISPSAITIFKGNFTGTPGHTVSGNVEIISENNQKKLVLKNFSTTNGPDLKIYIATSQQATAFISLGNLKSTNGQQVYDISGMPDFVQYKYVLIWCQQFSVLFGTAELK
ncbi:MAG TPA: DM13 domain-containing protein [Allocoleopsis sp.]